MGTQVSSIQQRVDFIRIQVSDDDLVGLLHRNCRDSPGLLKAGWQLVLKELEEGLDGSQSRLPLDEKFGWSDLQSLGGEANQQLEGLGIGVSGLHAHFPLAGQILTEEGGQMRAKRCHRSHRWPASAAVAMSPSSLGVACRYQYVSETCAWPR